MNFVRRLTRFLIICAMSIVLFLLLLFVQLTMVEGYAPTPAGMKQFVREWKAYQAATRAER